MHKFARRFASVSNPPNGSKYYSLIESVVCVYPDLLPESNVPNNHKVRVFGYPDFLKFITETTRNPGWSMEDWTSFAMELGLVRQEQAMTSAEIATAKDKELIEDYLRRFRDFYEKSIPPLVPTTIQTGDSRTKSSKYLNLFSNGAHIQLVGPAGSGKSHCIRVSVSS